LNREDMVWYAVLNELAYARELYPAWPNLGHMGDPVYVGSIFAEEAGEVIKSINDFYMHGKGSEKEIVQETIQAIAMGVRLLCDTPRLKDVPV
jgi:hypothetical protein